MRIDESNGIILNSKEVYIHDDFFNQLKFERSKKNLYLSITKRGIQGKDFIIEFVNVVGFELTSCDFWGTSPYILDFEYVEHCDRSILPKLFEEKKHISDSGCSLTDIKNYIESVITFKSGDRLIIACEYIILEEPSENYT